MRAAISRLGVRVFSALLTIVMYSRDDKRYTEKKNKAERARRKKEDTARLRNMVDLTLGCALFHGCLHPSLIRSVTVLIPASNESSKKKRKPVKPRKSPKCPPLQGKSPKLRKRRRRNMQKRKPRRKKKRKRFAFPPFVYV